MMDVDTEADKRYNEAASMSAADHGDSGAMSDPDDDGRSYTVTRLPASEHAELASAVLNSAGPKINCGPVTSEARMGDHHRPVSGDWPADHTAIC